MSPTPSKRAREMRNRATTAKSLMHVQSFCFANYKPIVFLPFSLPSPSLLLKLHISVIQKFCYHGNVMSYTSPLYPGVQIT